MSGQPTNTQADINRKRNEYLETLNLQESINDMNLQANKTYLLTGQLPPQSQMQDTRTNAEKLADVEKLKSNIADALKPIAESGFSHQIVNKVMNSPLNVDNSLIRFLAQRVDGIVEQLKKLIPYGIAGDDNDLERIVEFIKNMYAEQQGKYQSTKSYLNSTSTMGSSSSRIIGTNDIDSVILGIEDINKNLELIRTGTTNRITPQIRNLTGDIIQTLIDLKNVLPTTDQINLLLDDVNNIDYNNPYDNNAVNLEPNLPPIQPYSRAELEAFYKLIETLPKYSIVMALINKIKQYISSANFQLVQDGLLNLQKLFQGVFSMNTAGLRRMFQNIKNRQQFKQKQSQKMEAMQTRQFITQQTEEARDASRANKVYIVNPANSPVYTRQAPDQAGPQQGQVQQAPVGALPVAQAPQGIERPQGRDDRVLRRMQALENTAQQGWNAGDFHTADAIIQIASGITNINYAGNFNIAPGAGNVQDYLHAFGQIRNDLNMNGIAGYGIRRRGRPRGSGLVKVVVPKVPNFVGFGINEINQKQLNNSIVKIRRNTKTNYMDMPSRRVSKNLQSVLKTIVGGGVPKYDELGRLDDDEKDYLHKLINRSSLDDRLSVPAPSKDQQEKDIHNFEVMKGQIMSGNDSIELVRKFKLLTRKLSKQGLLPKADVDDINDTLTDLGY